MPYVRVYINSDDVLDDLDMDDICEHLVKQDGYKDAIAEAEAKKNGTKHQESNIESDVLELITHYQLGKPIEYDLSRIADIHFGKVI